jgi:hypothetical protein
MTRTKSQESCQSSLPERNPFQEWDLARPGHRILCQGPAQAFERLQGVKEG